MCLHQIPGALHKAVSDQLARIVHGKPPDVTGNCLCVAHKDAIANSANASVVVHRYPGLLSSDHLLPAGVPQQCTLQRKHRQGAEGLAQRHPSGPQDLGQEEEELIQAVLPVSP